MDSPVSMTTKQKIVKATMSIIAEEGVEKTTVRKIASRAGVNVAAVNYHFGGKDAVINESFTAVTQELKNAFRFLRDVEGQDVINISMFINEYTDIMYKYPDLLKNAIDLVIRRRVVEVDYMTFLRTEGIDLIQAVIARIRPELDQNQIQLKSLQLISQLSYPFLLGDLIQELMGIDLRNPDNRYQYSSMVLHSICYPGIQ